MNQYPYELSLVLPAYNEVLRLPPSLERLRQYLAPTGRPYEVLVVDDGSRDGTGQLVQEACRTWPELGLVTLEHNRGKGAAVRAGMLQARGRLRLFSDADLSTPIEELAKLERQIASGAGVAIGSRALPGSRVELHQPAYRELMGKTYNRALRLLVLRGLHDTQCGFKLFTAEATVACFRDLKTPGFGFDAEVLLRAQMAGIPIAEVPVVWRNAQGTRVNSLRDGTGMLLELFQVRHRARSNHRSAAEP
ncbi:MAG: dolichyl-phosphate beta-glucosyltransferase [Candidatus Dormibacteria bacterium]